MELREFHGIDDADHARRSGAGVFEREVAEQRCSAPGKGQAAETALFGYGERRERLNRGPKPTVPTLVSPQGA